MKKIILLFIILFAISGCSDYKEINEFVYVSGVGIDYVNDEFILTFEIINNQKDSQDLNINTYTMADKGSTISEAHMNLSSKLKNTSFFSHTQIIILTENLINNKLEETIDFIIINPRLNEEFLL